MNADTSASLFNTLQQRAVQVGVGGLAVGLVWAFFNAGQFFRSYLFAYLLWFGFALGSLAVVMIHHLVGGRWGFVSRRVLEAAARTLPVLAGLFVPILVGLSSLYSWAQPELVASDAILQHKSAYLNVPFFILRTLIYFAIWIGMAHLLSSWSVAQDTPTEQHPPHDSDGWACRFEGLSGPGLVVYGGTMTFAAVDWAMSLDSHWFSTIYGVSFMVGQVLTSLAFVIVVLFLLSDRAPLSAVLGPDQFHDLGNLLLAFVMLWAYMAFSQYLIIWSGNLPEETSWYVQRLQGGWRQVGLGLILLHFVVPFVILLSRRTKRSRLALALVASSILVMRWVDLWWLIMPGFRQGFPLHPLDLVLPVGIGGIWLAAFVWRLQERPLVPLQDSNQDPYQDPYQDEPLGHRNTTH